MIPPLVVVLAAACGIPRESGDDPFFKDYARDSYGYSPRERG